MKKKSSNNLLTFFFPWKDDKLSNWLQDPDKTTQIAADLGSIYHQPSSRPVDPMRQLTNGDLLPPNLGISGKKKGAIWEFFLDILGVFQKSATSKGINDSEFRPAWFC